MGFGLAALATRHSQAADPATVQGRSFSDDVRRVVQHALICR